MAKATSAHDSVPDIYLRAGVDDVHSKHLTPATPKMPALATVPTVTKRKAQSVERIELAGRNMLKLCLPLLMGADAPARALGFTSAIAGEGKSLLASITAHALADEAGWEVVLLDGDWHHPTLHTRYSVPLSPGLAEWVKGECSARDIRHTITSHLSVIPAGDCGAQALALAERLHMSGLYTPLGLVNEVLIADLPPVATTTYGYLIPQLLDTSFLVVRAGATSTRQVLHATEALREARVSGVLLNSVHSRIPRWMRVLF